MSKRFVLICEVETPTVTANIVNFLTSKRFGWAHYIKHSWILTHEDSSVSTANIREGLRSILDGTDYMIVEVFEGGWSARGKIDGDFLPWMKNKFLTLSEEKKQVNPKP